MVCIDPKQISANVMMHYIFIILLFDMPPWPQWCDIRNNIYRLILQTKFLYITTIKLQRTTLLISYQMQKYVSTCSTSCHYKTWHCNINNCYTTTFLMYITRKGTTIYHFVAINEICNSIIIIYHCVILQGCDKR